MGNLASLNVKQYIDKFNTPTFVETGTLWGNGVQAALDAGFSTVFSIEANLSIAKKARQRFAGLSNVNIIHGYSDEIFKTLLPSINTNIVFFLDAHYCGADAGLALYTAEQDDDKRLPLQRELELIKELRKGKNDVCCLDDIWIYRKDSKALSRPEIVPRQEFATEFWKNILKDTHDCEIIEKDEVYAILTPKK